MEKQKIKTIIIIGIFVLAFAAVFSVEKIMTANVIKQQEEQEDYQEWLTDNCNCTEWERIKCKKGFEYNEDRGYCISGKKLTNPLLACSKYNCNEEIVAWNNKTKLWSPVLEF